MRKVDLHLVPWFFTLGIACYLDRWAGLAKARQRGSAALRSSAGAAQLGRDRRGGHPASTSALHLPAAAAARIICDSCAISWLPPGPQDQPQLCSAAAQQGLAADVRGVWPGGRALLPK